MANIWEHTASALAGAGQPLALGDDHAEGLDGAAALEMERMAEIMVRRGVERRLACGCAADLFASQAKADAMCAGGTGEASVAANAAGSINWIGSPDASDIMAAALDAIWQARDSRLAVGCLHFAQGKAPYGAFTMRALAERQGVSVEAVSNGVGDFQVMLGLLRTPQQKSEVARAAYAKMNGAPSKQRSKIKP